MPNCVKFLYTGGGDTSYYGYDFAEGVATEVVDAKAIAKFRWNVFFTEIHDEAVTEISASLEKPIRKTRHL